MKKLLFCFFILIFFPSSGQSYKITYEKWSNGSKIENQDPILVFTNSSLTLVTSVGIFSGKNDFPLEQTYIDRGKQSIIQSAQFNQNKFIATKDSLALGKQTLELLNETKTILGYKCQKAKTIINSNTIELWYTKDLNIQGAPTVLGQNLGLVLEMNRNDNFVITATKIEKLKKFPSGITLPKANFSDGLTYRDLLWKSRFITLSVFENETINFSDQSKSNDSILRFANGTVILRKMKFPTIKNGSPIFVELKTNSTGDAYDRTGSLFVIPANAENTFFNGLKNGINTLPIYQNGNGKTYQGVVLKDDYQPLTELMRFFTPFGIKQYNHISLKDKTWYNEVPYRQDISELQPVLSGQEMWVGAFIGNYDQGGHSVSAEITIHPQENESKKKTFALPLFNTTNVMEMGRQEYATMFSNEKGLEVTFTLDKTIKNAQLRYITTGHGGWENGDEFVPKKNSIYLNEQLAFSFIPWRQDCGSYRLFNPASGNFDNGLSSSDYSRSNWCPGTVTNPMLIDLGDLSAGKHTLRVQIPQGLPEGGSFSAWNVSGILLGELEE
ncbi:GLPGLI family protein [Flavobacterium azooxidireducens]|uniref:GLPGLI family protein n=1 Tax=Flavobacterium azooxidireducens TaxID=1871076 RepID=A0ABY4KBN1_9FLAO|nr:GLPGLI family protein [Flavobacterium azooxidireducens]UPQ78189.1 GLPGLI family protein [Flavobacterium azooxidireducens]